MKNKNLSELNGYLISVKDEDIVRHTINAYLKQLSHAQIHLKQPRLEHICSKEMCSYIHENYDVLLKRMKAFRCRIEYYRVEPEFSSINFDNQICNVRVVAKEKLKFDKVRSETLRYNTHKFELLKVKNKWIIYSDVNDEQDSRSLYKPSREQHKKTDKSLNMQLNLMKNLLKIKLSRNITVKPFNPDTRLKREKMKQYQIENWNKRPRQWGNFDDMGGDCTNYASQVVYAGGAPMIISTNYKWYYYNYNNRTPSWTSVEQFYDFLIKNKADGIHGIDLPSNLELKTGDIVQVDLDGDGIFNHTSVVYEPFGYMGILPTITSHSLDRFNEPILTFDFTDIRWIHLT